MWQNIAAAALLLFGVVIGIVVVVIYLRMYKKQNSSQVSDHNLTSFVSEEGENEKIV